MNFEAIVQNVVFRWIHGKFFQNSLLDSTENLFEKIVSEENLFQAFVRIRQGGNSPGVDGETLALFESCWMTRLMEIERDLRNGTYAPLPVRQVFIRKPGSMDKRVLGISVVRDRVVQAAILQALEPGFDPNLSDNSFAYRAGRGVQEAHQRVEKFLRDGKFWLVDGDFKNFFDTIPRQELLQILTQKIADEKTTILLRKIISQKIWTGKREISSKVGICQGSVLSPFFSNVFLDSFDRFFEEADFRMVRYADNFLLFCDSYLEAVAALRLAKWMAGELKLKLNPAKTRVLFLPDEPNFTFLGQSLPWKKPDGNSENLDWLSLLRKSILQDQHHACLEGGFWLNPRHPRKPAFLRGGFTKLRDRHRKRKFP